MTRAGARFSRVEPRRRARAFVLGLLAELPRKNCWTIAEHAGDRTPDGMQHLLSQARWDAGGVRDDVRSYVVEQLGDPGAVLVVDETGDVKKGAAVAALKSVNDSALRSCVARQTEHCYWFEQFQIADSARVTRQLSYRRPAAICASYGYRECSHDRLLVMHDPVPAGRAASAPSRDRGPERWPEV